MQGGEEAGRTEDRTGMQLNFQVAEGDTDVQREVAFGVDVVDIVVVVEVCSGELPRIEIR